MAIYPKMSRYRLKPGDVLEIALPDGVSYVQYVGEHPEYGGTIWVVPRVFHSPLKEVGSSLGERGYYTFYPARTAVSRKLVRVAGAASLDGRSVPLELRRAGARGPEGAIHTWIVSSPDHEYVRETLTASERRLPIAAIWNHEMLVQRIRDGWLPDDNA